MRLVYNDEITIKAHWKDEKVIEKKIYVSYNSNGNSQSFTCQ